MTAPEKWLDAAALDEREEFVHSLDKNDRMALIAQARAALTLRDELAECRAKLGAAEANAAENLAAWERGESERVELRRKLEQAETRLSIHENLTALEADNAMRDERDAALAKLAQAQMEGGVWRCSCCGELRDLSAAWRWNGERWEHKCAGSLPQAGHMPAECFGFVMPHASVVDLMFRLIDAERERDEARKEVAGCVAIVQAEMPKLTAEMKALCGELVNKAQVAFAAAQAESLRALEALAAWREVEMAEGTDISDEDMMALNATAHDLTTRCLAGYKPGSRDALREMLTKAVHETDANPHEDPEAIVARLLGGGK